MAPSDGKHDKRVRIPVWGMIRESRPSEAVSPLMREVYALRLRHGCSMRNESVQFKFSVSLDVYAKRLCDPCSMHSRYFSNGVDSMYRLKHIGLDL